MRLVGFSSEDAGFIDRVLSDSPGGMYTNADVVDEDVNTVKTTGARAPCAGTRQTMSMRR